MILNDAGGGKKAPYKAPKTSILSVIKPKTTTSTYSSAMKKYYDASKNIVPPKTSASRPVAHFNTASGRKIITPPTPIKKPVVVAHPAVVAHSVAHAITSAPAHQVSIAALSGNKTAQSYLNAVHASGSTPSNTVVPTKPIVSPVPSGSDGGNPVTPITPATPAAPPRDWSGWTKEKFDAGTEADRAAYVNDNPYSDVTKQYEMNNYGAMSDWLKANKPIADYQLDSYRNLVNKWNLTDYTDPYNQMNDQNKANQKDALNAQDVALNTGMGQMDANSFQQFQQLQQQMNDRGMGDSGIAQDAYMRAQMGNNQNYQQAFADAATKKADITNQYAQQSNDIVGKDLAYKADRADANAKNAQAQQQAQIDLLKQQTVQDQYLTTSTGMVYMGGKPLTSGGKPITSVEYQKLSETQRHNIALENNTATKNAQDYSIGMDKNSIARQKVSSDLQQALAKNKLEYSKLDYDYAKLDSNNSYNQDKIRIAADNAQSTADRNQLNALGKQSSDLTSQITAYQKKGNKPPKSLVDKYNQTNDAISKIVSGASFKNSGGGGGTTSAGQSAFAKNFASSGVSQAWYPLMAEIVRKESSYNPKAQNPTSTAYGYAQFLKSTRQNYEKKLGLNYDNPVDQITMMAEYIKDRYGTPAKANEWWNSHHWY